MAGKTRGNFDIIKKCYGIVFGLRLLSVTIIEIVSKGR